MTSTSFDKAGLPLAALGTALPAAGLVFVLVTRPQELWLSSDEVIGPGVWRVFAAFLFPATVIAALGLYSVAQRRRGWTFFVSAVLLNITLWFMVVLTESLVWLRVLCWAPAILFLASAGLAARAGEERAAGSD